MNSQATSLASLLGILFYVTFLRQASIRSILFWSTVLVTPFCFLPCFMVARWNVAIGLSDVAFLLTDTVLMEFVGEFQCLPLLILAAQLCPVGLESTLYAILLSANHLGLTVSALVSAGLIGLLGITATNFFHLGFLVALCAASNLLPLLLLPLVPKTCSASAFIARVELPDEHTGSQQPVASEETPLCVKPSDYSPDYADPFYATSSSICQNGFTSHRPMHCPESTNNDITNAQVLRFQQEGIKTPSSCTTITEDQEKGEEQGSSPRMAILRDTVIHDNMIMAAHILNIQ